jgi:hypothetical protein
MIEAAAGSRWQPTGANSASLPLEEAEGTSQPLTRRTLPRLLLIESDTE